MNGYPRSIAWGISMSNSAMMNITNKKARLLGVQKLRWARRGLDPARPPKRLLGVRPAPPRRGELRIDVRRVPQPVRRALENLLTGESRLAAGLAVRAVARVGRCRCRAADEAAADERRSGERGQCSTKRSHLSILSARFFYRRT